MIDADGNAAERGIRIARVSSQQVLQEASTKIAVEPAPLRQVLDIVETGCGDVSAELHRFGELFREKDGMSRAEHIGPIRRLDELWRSSRIRSDERNSAYRRFINSKR